MVPLPSSSSPEWLRRWVNPTAPLLLYRNYSRSRAKVQWPKTYRSLPRCSGSIQCLIRSGMTRASKNSAKKNRSAGRDPHSTRWQTRLVSEPDDEGVPAGSSTQRNQPEPRAQYFKKAGEIVNLDELGKFLCRAEETQRLQGCCRLRDRRLALD